ncbi:MAG: caspase family protein [Bacteroidota bacterium]
MENNLHALLIAINDYDPRSKVRNLRGCINDLQSIYNLLTNQYNCPVDQIKTLVNEQATRENIIVALQTHLCTNPTIKAGDTVLFYYSGHGSRSRTANEFAKFDPQQYDETLVCYDSRIPAEGHYDLADKEIAALFSRVKSGVEVVLIVDACHSDSIFRDDGLAEETLTARYTPKRTTPRPLTTYLLPEDDFYEKMATIEVPQNVDLALVACQRDQYALESNGHGLFTKNLVRILTNTAGKISCRQLYERVNLAVRKRTHQQNPQLSVPNNFDIYRFFLRKERSEVTPPFEVHFKHGHWCLNHGAIYGLDTDEQAIEAMEVAIYTPHQEGQPRQHLGNVGVTAVHLKTCQLVPKIFEEYCQPLLEDFPDFLHEREKSKQYFQAEIISVLPNLTVYLNAPTAVQTIFEQRIKKAKLPYCQFVREPIGTTYELVLHPEYILLKNRKTDKIIHGVHGSSAEASVYILKKVAQIEAWERMVQLENVETQLNHSQVNFRFLDENSNRYYENKSTIRLDYREKPVNFQLDARNLSGRDLYFGLVHLSPKFGINNFFECEQFPAANSDWTTLDKRHHLKITDTNAVSVTDIFKLIVSTAPFDDYKFIQPDMVIGKVVNLSEVDNRRDISERDSVEHEPEEDWAAFTTMVQLVR